MNTKANQGQVGHFEEHLQPVEQTPVEQTPEEVLAWTGLLRVSSMLTRRLDLELRREHGLSISEWEVLFLVGRAGGHARMSELAREALLTQGGITHLLGRLEKRGLARKESDEEDRRVQRAALTGEGRTRLEAATRTHVAGVREHFYQHFSKQELALLASFWERLLPDHAEIAFGKDGDPRQDAGYT